ncbi:MAG: hypothetical protein HUJ25_09200 [Crocinitomicaceae bacterium]|nr:hypothetical protein [Crocinitomicaceae bacterium]
MKNLFALFALLTLATVSNAQLSATNSHPLADFYGKKMFVESHTKNGTNVDHSAGDYIIFKEDKGVFKDWNGFFSEGIWSYDAGSKILTVSAGGKVEYTVAEVNSNQLVLTTSNESLVLQLTTTAKQKK